MRFCPFCSAENDDAAAECAACGRRLPPLTPRRQGSQLGELRASEVLPSSSVTPLPTRSSAPVTTAPRPEPPAVPPPRRPSSMPSASRAAAGTPLRAVSEGGDPGATGSGRARSSTPPPVPRSPTDSALQPRRSPTDSALQPPRRSPTDSALLQPPPTRMIERDQTPVPQVSEVPEVPEPGIVPAVRYTLAFAKARWQRRGAISALREQIRTDTAALDRLLGTLGETARSLKLEHRAFQGELEAIDAAETRRAQAETESAELHARQAEENTRFGELEAERQDKVSDVETQLTAEQDELSRLEAQRRGLRDKRKELEKRQRGYLKSAEDREAEGNKQQNGDERAELRRAAEELRRDAAALDPDRQDVERRLSALEKPISQAMAKVEGLKAELEAARRALNDAREGHRHRLAEIEAEQGRKTRELAQAEAEIQRRLVTLGTLVNLNRVDRPELSELYGQIDVLRGSIGAASTEIDRFSSEREAFDRATLLRGGAALGASLVVVLSLLAIVLAAL